MNATIATVAIILCGNIKYMGRCCNISAAPMDWNISLGKIGKFLKSSMKDIVATITKPSIRNIVVDLL